MAWNLTIYTIGLQLIASALMLPDILNFEYHVQNVTAPWIEQKNPFIQDVNKHMFSFKKLQISNELHFFISPWLENHYLRGIVR